MRANYYVLILAAVVASTSLFMYKQAQGRRRGISVIHAATVTYSRLFYGADGARAPGAALTEILGVRSDGSSSRARLVPAITGSSQVYNLRITDTAKSLHVVVDQLTKSKTTYPDPNIVAEYTIKAVNSCPGSESDVMLGHKTFLSDRTVGEAGSSNIRIIREWRAPDLNCLPLRQEQWSAGTSGSRVLSMLLVASQVADGEPPSWMFSIPTDFTERSPGEMLAESARVRQEASPGVADSLERAYLAANSAQK